MPLDPFAQVRRLCQICDAEPATTQRPTGRFVCVSCNLQCVEQGKKLGLSFTDCVRDMFSRPQQPRP